MSAQVDLSVVVVSYNTCHLLKQCLASVLRTSLLLEAIVVDNASVDGSADMVQSDFSQARLLRNDRNVGFAAATNQGLAQASGRYLVLLNPDAEVRPGALEAMVDFLDHQPKVAAAGPQLRYPSGARQQSCFNFPTLVMSFFDFFPINHRFLNSRLNGRYPWKDDGVPFPIDHPLGACMVVRREAMEQVGMLDEGFFIYCEEVDWCWRMKKAGWAVYCVPEAVVVHHEAQSTRQRAPAMFVELHRSRRRLFAKHRSPAFRWASRQLVRLGLLREMYRSWRRSRKGEMKTEDYRAWMASYRAVFGM
jgi:N-acetylglucosaminyl-diphospho-decaprenol L-rhamnosyltransferase